MSTRAEFQRIETIEAARGIAALAVVLFHADSTFASRGGGALLQGFSPFSWGERGVDFFFVLSGFIIYHAHRQDPRGFGPLVTYGVKRAIRIYPLLWLVAGLVFAANFLIDREAPSIEKLSTSFLLTPSLVWPGPSVSWTLRHEILFYALFAVGMVNGRLGGLVLALWFMACAAQAVAIGIGRNATGLTAFFLSPLNLDFALGIGAAALSIALPGRRLAAWSMVIAALALASVFGAFVLMHGPSRKALEYAVAGQTAWDLAFGVAFGLVVFSLARLNSRVRVPGWLVFLGGASYALYLVHTPVMGFAGRFVVPPLSGTTLAAPLAYGALIAMSLIAAVTVHLGFEKPVTRHLRRRLLRTGVVPVLAP